MSRTLPQVSKRQHIDGQWPGSVVLRRGWSKLTARPWNDDVNAVAVRLHRGSSEFLVQTTETMRELSDGQVLSPALYPTATKVWKRSGYQLLTNLDVMERVIGPGVEAPSGQVAEAPAPDLAQLAEIDRSAFEEFWRMGVAGLDEAYRATPDSTVFISRDGDIPTGYALVGVHSGISFLQRVAVIPAHRGQGQGSQLVRACLLWAASKGGRAMVLNVRPENVAARGVYEKQGFNATGMRLELLEYMG